MNIPDGYPYSNQHELNLDWTLAKLREFSISLEHDFPELATLVGRYRAEVENLNSRVSTLDVTLETSVEDAVSAYLARSIYVEINNDGYIVFNVPDSWDEIEFNTTGLDITVSGIDEYGRLVLSY